MATKFKLILVGGFLASMSIWAGAPIPFTAVGIKMTAADCAQFRVPGIYDLSSPAAKAAGDLLAKRSSDFAKDWKRFQRMSPLEKRAKATRETLTELYASLALLVGANSNGRVAVTDVNDLSLEDNVLNRMKALASLSPEHLVEKARQLQEKLRTDTSDWKKQLNMPGALQDWGIGKLQDVLPEVPTRVAAIKDIKDKKALREAAQADLRTLSGGSSVSWPDALYNRYLGRAFAPVFHVMYTFELLCDDKSYLTSAPEEARDYQVVRLGGSYRRFIVEYDLGVAKGKWIDPKKTAVVDENSEDKKSVGGAGHHAN